MTVQEVIRAAHFVVDESGRRQAAVVGIAEWQRLLAWIEAVVDVQAAEAALRELAESGETPEAAERLKVHFVLEGRGLVEIKGKGPMHTAFLTGRAQR